MKKFIVGIYNKSVILTYIGACISILGMFLVRESIENAMVCLVAAGICDLFDGKVARMCKRNDEEKNFGIQIDSLVDVVSFLVFPIVILCNVCECYIIAYVVSAVYLLAGITRLAWFNITTDGYTKYYRGLPVTYSALILPIFYMLSSKVLGCDYLINILLPLIYLIIALFFILNIKIKKPSGIWYVIFSILAIITIIILLY